MKLLLAGVTGQLGTAVAELAADRGIALVPVVREDRRGRVPFARAYPLLAPDKLIGDVRAAVWGLNESTLDELSQDVDAVVNLAGDTNWAGSGRELYAVNVLGARHGLDVARELQRRSGRRICYCYASSIFVAGGLIGPVAELPLSPDRHRTGYEHSKWLAERELAGRLRPGDPDVLISRVGALLGDSQTGRTLKRNSLYLLAERWDDLPGRLLPVMPGARVDALPRDVAAATLLDSISGMLAGLRAGGTAEGGSRPEPVITHLSAGERAPTLRGLLEVARALAPLKFGTWVRPVPATAGQVLWLSANAERYLPLSKAWRNSLIGLRYIGLDRVMERGRLGALLDADPAAGALPAPEVELLARLLFDLPAAQRALAPADAGLSRFQP